MKEKISPEARRIPFVGRWSFIEADCFDRDYLDLCEPAMLVISEDGDGEITFGALQAGLTFSFGAETAFFDWCGHDEMDEAKGEGMDAYRSKQNRNQI